VTAYATWNSPSLQNQGRALRLVAGGWALSPIVILQSGAPFTVTCGLSFVYPNDAGGCNWVADNQNGNRPNAPAFGNNQIPGLNFNSWINGAFGPNPFSTFPAPALGTVGSLGRNTYTTPGLASTDLSLRKNFNLYGERWKFQFRADAFNLFNRVNLVGIDGGMQDGTFGQATGTLNPREIQIGLKLLF
jgi:hypothetical protein